MTTKRGSRLSTSVGGVLTGRGGNLIVVDDPIKPADGNSAAGRAHVIDWYGGTLISRLNEREHDAIVAVMQRLHEGDLIGHLLREEGWTHLNLPAIAEFEQQVEIGPGQFHTRRVGDLLHPERESKVALDGLKRAMGSATFAAQYQQSPVPPGGNMIDWNWFRWYDPNKPPKFEKIIISWDTAMKATELCDYSVATVWGEFFDCYFLLDLVRERLEYPALRRKVIDVHNHWHFHTGLRPKLVIEDAGAGSALVQELRHMNIPAHAMRPVGDKITRMAAQSAKIEGSEVYLPSGAPWLKDFRTEVLAFPKGDHDDQVDSMSQALSYLADRPTFVAFAV
jgi:predicted phage terminase large subunit-like protein